VQVKNIFWPRASESMVQVSVPVLAPMFQPTSAEAVTMFHGRFLPGTLCCFQSQLVHFFWRFQIRSRNATQEIPQLLSYIAV